MIEWVLFTIACSLVGIVVGVGIYLRKVVKEVNKELGELIENWGSKL